VLKRVMLSQFIINRYM